jgi:putative nucleotidyltransferase with HDIG domain
MINILFVDDEPNILDGLKRMLRPLRHEWTVFLAKNGTEALNLLTEKPMDVIVSDMKMPRMDGASLLQEVSRLYPQIVRIILSGYSESEMIIKSVNVAHQYLSKPSDPEILKETVNNACALRNLLGNEKLRCLVSQMPSVPSLPTLYSRLLKELEQPDPRMDKIAKIVKQDIGMTAKILQIVNSAFFGLSRNITDAAQAINFLGLDTVKSLTLGVGVFSQFEKNYEVSQIISKTWTHSIAVGRVAKAISEQVNPAVAGDAFTAGLLHDIGKLLLAVNMPEKFAQSEKLVEGQNYSRTEAEKQCFETTHSEVGAYLLGLWGLPHQVVEAVAFHHIPGDFQTDKFTALTAVHIANAINHCGIIDLTSEPENFVDVKYLQRLDLMEQIKTWQEKYTKIPNKEI